MRIRYFFFKKLSASFLSVKSLPDNGQFFVLAKNRRCCCWILWRHKTFFWWRIYNVKLHRCLNFFRVDLNHFSFESSSTLMRSVSQESLTRKICNFQFGGKGDLASERPCRYIHEIKETFLRKITNNNYLPAILWQTDWELRLDMCCFSAHKGYC